VPQAIEDTQKSESLVNKESSMKTHCGRLLAIEVIGWASMMAGATPAMAQDWRTLAQEHFTLPHEVHWKSSILPPGGYTFELRGNSVWMTVELHGPAGDTRVSGPRSTANRARSRAN